MEILRAATLQCNANSNHPRLQTFFHSSAEIYFVTPRQWFDLWINFNLRPGQNGAELSEKH
jgi:hypothetical protein